MTSNTLQGLKGQPVGRWEESWSSSILARSRSLYFQGAGFFLSPFYQHFLGSWTNSVWRRRAWWMHFWGSPLCSSAGRFLVSEFFSSQLEKGGTGRRRRWRRWRRKRRRRRRWRRWRRRRRRRRRWRLADGLCLLPIQPLLSLGRLECQAPISYYRHYHITC